MWLQNFAFNNFTLFFCVMGFLICMAAFVRFTVLHTCLFSHQSDSLLQSHLDTLNQNMDKHG